LAGLNCTLTGAARGAFADDRVLQPFLGFVGFLLCHTKAVMQQMLYPPNLLEGTFTIRISRAPCPIAI